MINHAVFLVPAFASSQLVSSAKASFVLIGGQGSAPQSCPAPLNGHSHKEDGQSQPVLGNIVRSMRVLRKMFWEKGELLCLFRYWISCSTLFQAEVTALLHSDLNGRSQSYMLGDLCRVHCEHPSHCSICHCSVTDFFSRLMNCKLLFLLTAVYPHVEPGFCPLI